MRRINQLNVAVVSRLREPGRSPDGLGLILQVKKSGAKSWLFRYVREGRERWMGLGATHTVSLAEAREAARRCRTLLLSGSDPLAAQTETKGKARAEAARGISFQECAEQYIRLTLRRLVSIASGHMAEYVSGLRLSDPRGTPGELNRHRTSDESDRADLDNQDRHRYPAARSHRESSGLGGGPWLPLRREPGALEGTPRTTPAVPEEDRFTGSPRGDALRRSTSLHDRPPRR